MYLYYFIYICVCVCVCEGSSRSSKRQPERRGIAKHTNVSFISK